MKERMNEGKGDETREEIWHKINRETARITWEELQPHFDAGSIVVVDNSQDLVDVAFQFTSDNKEQVQTWLEQGVIARASEADAEMAKATPLTFWAVVVAPWILIQVAQ